MRFCDLFVSYKIGLKSIKNTIPFTKLPFYRKIFMIIFLANAIISMIFLVFQRMWGVYTFLALCILLFLVFFIIDSQKRNLELMLKDYYVPYSEKRMLMTINVLREYKIDIHNSELIDMLIEEAKLAQSQCDYIAPFKKPLKILRTVIVPIIAYLVQKLDNVVQADEMFVIVIQIIVLVLLIFALIFVLTPFIKDILYRDYNRYDELICDLRQIKIFYMNEKIILI